MRMVQPGLAANVIDGLLAERQQLEATAGRAALPSPGAPFPPARGPAGVECAPGWRRSSPVTERYRGAPPCVVVTVGGSLDDSRAGAARREEALAGSPGGARGEVTSVAGTGRHPRTRGDRR